MLPARQQCLEKHPCSKASPAARSRPAARASICATAEGAAAPAAARQSADPRVVAWRRRPARQHFHVVCPDLRGYGDSVGPEEGGKNHINYSFRAMALDQVELMEQLGHCQFMVAGHDRGARTAARMCLDHPDRVQTRRRGRHPAQPPHLDPHLEGVGDPVVALAVHDPALRHARAHDGRRPAAYTWNTSCRSPASGSAFSIPRRSRSTSAASPGRRSAAPARTTAPAPPATSRWTPPTTTPAARSTVRCS